MEKVEFTGSQGHMLAARMDGPRQARAYALFAHCFASSKDMLAASRIAKSLTDRDIAVMRFDFTGLGASEGDFETTNFSSNIQDLAKAADFMRDTFEAPAILIGHSLGGAAVLGAAHHVPECKAVVTIGAPAEVTHVIHHFEHKRHEIEQNGEAEVFLAGQRLRIQKQFIDDLEAQTMDEKIQTLDKALLVMHAPLDDVVGIENAQHIYQQAKHPKSFVSLDNADHLITRKKHAAYAADVIATWAGLYVGA